MEKVYVLIEIQNFYDNCGDTKEVVGVYRSKEDANTACQKLNDSNNYFYLEYCVNEFILK